MFIWDQYQVPKIDLLCPLRAYFHHSIMACIHHSFILLAIERFCKIRQVKFLKTQRQKICLVLFQWIFDFTFALPVLLTGNMVKVESDNFCFVTLTRVDLVLYLGIVAFLLTNITLSIIYRSLVRHVRQASAKLNNNQQVRMQRDLTMVRRIVLLNSQLALIGIPVLVLIILATQLYLKIVKEESKFQHEKFEKVLNDFLQHVAQKTPSSSSTFGRVDERDDNNRKHFDVHSDKEDDDVDEFFTQRKAPPLSSPQRHTKSMNKEEEREDVE
ncbi:unnamed protein product [Adineta steineri]|uniref:G-protein coupled receptors family 1 profile domain-containing protein n=1 Tax=Adineta steineri TaxID=433720 RepID=A0A818KLB9_9BILA|nr:unnamed protein product [Adineta steineri]CAF1242161.1 unnamed protein product [Adineta steineri]CAF3562369.1 unnamed protein product [Adineta steineri]CAF3668528.1 unnamed protein product [Adineta steineri]